MREQYADASNLKARGNLHAKYGRRSWFDWLAAQFDVPEGARVLDLGCGPGAIWSQLDGTLPPHLSVVLADLSPGMVRHAVGQLQTAPWTCVDGHVADASQLPYADNVFDTVIAVHMLYHLPDPVRGVREVARVLRPTGRAYVTTNAIYNMPELFAVGAAAFGGPATDPAAQAFGLEGASEMLADCFANVEVRPFSDVLECTDADDVVAYLTSMPPGNQATSEQVEAARGLIANEMTAADGVFRVHRESGLLIAMQPRC